MGAVTFSLDQDLVSVLSAQLPLDVFIETGTFKGDTVEIVQPFFKKIYSIELSEEYFQQACKRYQHNTSINIMLGDSANLLTNLYAQYHDKSVVYWLDAHWCVANNTAGLKSQCPLLTEIAAIQSLNQDSCIIIDDARLFIATPPKPHEASHWPSFDSIITALHRVSNQHAIMILNDNIIFYPKKIEHAISNYAQTKGVDWLHIMNLSREHMTRCKPPFRTRLKQNKIVQFLYPRLGKLQQYQPRQVNIPSRYFKKKTHTSIPKISIVIPSYNQGQFLENTMLSVIQQNYSNLELIVQDGGSKDQSVDIIKKYEKKLHYWESKKDTGQANAINLGFAHSTGEIMAYLNSDDLLLPGAINAVVHFFETHPDVDVIYGNRLIIDENDLEIGRWILPRHSNRMLELIDFVPQETLFWRRSIWEKAGGCIDEQFQFTLDWDLLLRFKNAGAKFVRLPRLLGAFRVHSQQKTSLHTYTIGADEKAKLHMRTFQRVISRQEIKKELFPYFIKHLFLHAFHRLKQLFSLKRPFEIKTDY